MCVLSSVIRGRELTKTPCTCSISERRTLARLQSMLVCVCVSVSVCMCVCACVCSCGSMCHSTNTHTHTHTHTKFSARVDYRRQTRRVLRNDRSKRCRQDDGNQYAHRVFFIIDKFPVPTASTLLQENFHPYLQTA